MFDPYYTVSEAADVMGTSETPIRNAIHDGRLRATKRGGKWYINALDLMEYGTENHISTAIVPPQSRKDIQQIIQRYGMQQVAAPAGSPAYAAIMSSPCTELALLTQGPVKLLSDGQRIDGMYYFKKGGGGDGADLYLYVVILLDWPEDVPITTVPEGGEDNG